MECPYCGLEMYDEDEKRHIVAYGMCSNCMNAEPDEEPVEYEEDY